MRRRPSTPGSGPSGSPVDSASEKLSLLAIKDRDKGIAYRPSLLGYLTYDPERRSVTRFDLLAFGIAENAPRGVITGTYYLGVVYELVTRPTVSQLVWPRGARDGLAKYLVGAGQAALPR